MPVMLMRVMAVEEPVKGQRPVPRVWIGYTPAVVYVWDNDLLQLSVVQVGTAFCQPLASPKLICRVQDGAATAIVKFAAEVAVMDWPTEADLGEAVILTAEAACGNRETRRKAKIRVDTLFMAYMGNLLREG